MIMPISTLAKTRAPRPPAVVSSRSAPGNDSETYNDRLRLARIARTAMLDQGLSIALEPGALEELQHLPLPQAARKGVADIRDLRDLPWVSIDNDDSRDLDQVTVGERLDGGKIRIRVAVADVDQLVPKDSQLDRHARHNTTSVYTPALMFPMLPESLSTDLTSLNADQDRDALVVEMLFGPDSHLFHSEIYRARIHNHAKLAYRSVAAWLSGTGDAPRTVANDADTATSLRIQDALAQRLTALRHRQGALSLETPEPHATFDGNSLTHLDLDPNNRAKQLIEEFMIAANEVTASFLEAKEFPSLRRVLKSPERWSRIAQLALLSGTVLPDHPEATALENFLAVRRILDPNGFPDLSLAVVKLIGRGEYVVNAPGTDSPGHFGLAVKNYTHFTAPNRRYPDLISQRLVKAALAGNSPPYSITELDGLAHQCTDRENDATKVERRVRKSAAAMLLASRIGEMFDAIVTGASVKGVWVRTFLPAVEGQLVRGFETLDVGDRVRVKLIRADVERGFIDFVHE